MAQTFFPGMKSNSIYVNCFVNRGHIDQKHDKTKKITRLVDSNLYFTMAEVAVGKDHKLYCIIGVPGSESDEDSHV